MEATEIKPGFGECFKVVRLESGGFLAQAVNIPGMIVKGNDMEEIRKRVRICIKQRISMLQKDLDDNTIDFFETDDIDKDIDVRVNKLL